MNSNIKKVRIGNTIAFRFALKTNGEAESLEGRDIKVLLRDPIGRRTPISFGVSDTNVMTVLFEGTAQKTAGVYYIEVWENMCGKNQAVLDFRAVELVPHSSMASDTTCVCNMNEVESIDLEAVDIIVAKQANGIKTILKSETTGAGAANIYTIVLDDGTRHELHIWNGEDGTSADIEAAQRATKAANDAAAAAQKAADDLQQSWYNADAAISDSISAMRNATSNANIAKGQADIAANAANDAAGLADSAASYAKDIAVTMTALMDDTVKPMLSSADSAIKEANSAAEAARNQVRDISRLSENFDKLLSVTISLLNVAKMASYGENQKTAEYELSTAESKINEIGIQPPSFGGVI